jgi:hypothetical protein
MHKKLNASFSGRYSPISMPEFILLINILKIKVKSKIGRILRPFNAGAYMPRDSFNNI